MVSPEELIAFIQNPRGVDPSEQESVFAELNRRVQWQILRFYRNIGRTDLLSDADLRQDITDQVMDRLFLSKRRRSSEIANVDFFLFRVVRSVAVDKHRKDTGEARRISLDDPFTPDIAGLWSDFFADEQVQQSVAEEIVSELEKSIDGLPKKWRLVLRIHTMWEDPLTEPEIEEIAKLRGISIDQLEQELGSIYEGLIKTNERNRQLWAEIAKHFAEQNKVESQLSNLTNSDDHDDRRAELERKLENVRTRRARKLEKTSPVVPSAARIARLIGKEEISSINNVRTILFRARKKLRAQFEKRCNEIA